MMNVYYLFPQADISKLCKENAQLKSEKAQLERTLASMPEDVRAAQTVLQKEICDKDSLIQELIKSKQDVQSEVEYLTTN